jgi:hypothetical protein
VRLQIRNEAAAADATPRDPLPTSAAAGFHRAHAVNAASVGPDAVPAEVCDLEPELSGEWLSENKQPEWRCNRKGCCLLLLVFGLFVFPGILWVAIAFFA